MIRLLRNLTLAGLGAVDLTEEKLHTLFDELVQRGEVTEKDAKDLIAAWTKRATERREALSTQVRDIVREELARQNVPRRAELDALADHVARLERQVVPIEEMPAR